MITGQVNDDDQAVVTLRFVGTNDRQLDIECVVETGFTGDIGLTGAMAEALSLTSVGSTETTVAGATVQTNAYIATLEWHGRRAPAVALVMPRACVGMGLLKGNVLIATVSPGQIVQITPIT